MKYRSLFIIIAYASTAQCMVRSIKYDRTPHRYAAEDLEPAVTLIPEVPSEDLIIIPDTESDIFTIVPHKGDPFKIDKHVALKCKTIKDMLESCPNNNEIELPPGDAFMRINAIRFFKHIKNPSKEEIGPECVAPLFRLADYLQAPVDLTKNLAQRMLPISDHFKLSSLAHKYLNTITPQMLAQRHSLSLFWDCLEIPNEKLESLYGLDQISNPKKISSLNLSYNLLTETVDINRIRATLPNLTELDLRHNKITQVIGSLPYGFRLGVDSHTDISQVKHVGGAMINTTDYLPYARHHHIKKSEPSWKQQYAANKDYCKQILKFGFLISQFLSASLILGLKLLYVPEDGISLSYRELPRVFLFCNRKFDGPICAAGLILGFFTRNKKPTEFITLYKRERFLEALASHTIKPEGLRDIL